MIYVDSMDSLAKLLRNNVPSCFRTLIIGFSVGAVHSVFVLPFDARASCTFLSFLSLV